MMRKMAILLVCTLACLTLFTGCTDREDIDDQALNGDNDGGVDIADDVNGLDELAGADALPDGLTYRLKELEKSDGIVATPKE